MFTAAPPHYAVCQGLHTHRILYSTEMMQFFCVIVCAFTSEIQPIITLEGSISYTFQKEGKKKVTVQVASGNTVMQDTKVITVKGEWAGQPSKQFN